MNTKNIFKTLVLAAVLVSACGKNEIADDFKGYTLPVTINVSRQGDEPATRATYNESTKKLEFSTGDKLFVMGSHAEAGKFAGTLDYDAVSGKFSGTVTTEKEYTGTIDDLMASAAAFLLPAGYGSYEFFSVSGSGSDAMISIYFTKAFALTKAAAVEQFSLEYTASYSSGFALAPMNAIVNFTISGLTANKEVSVSFDTYGAGVISRNVTTSATGVATFAVGVSQGNDLKNCTLTVDGNNIAMPTKTTEAGHIYNISRSAAAAAEGHALSASVVGEIVGSDGKAYAVEDKDNLPTGVTAVAIVAYKGSETGEASPYNHGLALALSDANGGSECSWSTSYTQVHTYNPTSNSFTSEGGLQYNDATHNTDTYPAFKAAIANNGTAAPTGCSAWFLATGYQWKQMADAAGGYDKLGLSGYYWSSTEGVSYRAWYFNSGDGGWYRGSKTGEYLVRSCLAF